MNKISKYPNKMDEKLGKSFDILKIEYEHAYSRFRDWDNKLNMLLVFLASEVAVMGLILTSLKSINTAINILTIISVSLLAVALIGISAGLFPRLIPAIDIDGLVKLEQYDLDFEEFIGRYLGSYKVCIDKINNVNFIKSIIFLISVILLGLAYGCISAMGVCYAFTI